MANWYVRPDTSHGTTRDGTSNGTAWGGWSEIIWASLNAGDTLFLIGHFNFATTTAIGAHNGTTTNPVIIDGGGDYPGSITIAAGQSMTPRNNTKLQNITFNCTSRGLVSTASLSYFTVDTCIFNGGTNSIYTLSSSTGHNHTDIVITNCVFNGGNDTADLGTGAAIGWFVSATSAVSTVTRVTIQNNKFNSCNSLGNSRGVISFRTEEDTDATSIITDLIVDGNTFSSCRGYTLEAVDGHSYGAASPQFGLWKGFKFINNKIENQTVDDTNLLGGGCAAFGFSESTSANFGYNYITNNTMTNLEGQCGGINVGYGCYIIQNNKISNVKTYSIDGCGILLDDGIKRTIVSHNYIYNCSGNYAVTNSGAGIMFLNTNSTLVYGNIVDSCRYGLYLGSILAGEPSVSFNNTFVNIAQAGIIFGAISDRTAMQVYNNIFTGTNLGTNYSVQQTAGTAWTNENYNCFYNFASGALTHTLGANSVTTNPILYNKYLLKPTSSLIEAGRFVKNTTDYQNTWFNNPPSIGAYEYVVERAVR